MRRCRLLLWASAALAGLAVGAGPDDGSWLGSLSSMAQLSSLKSLGALSDAEHAAALVRLEGGTPAGEAAPVLLLSPPANKSLAGSLAQLGALQQAGMLSDDEFAQAKAALLGGGEASGGAVAAAEYVPGSVTWEELAQHTTKDNAWVAIHDEVYDFSCFFATPDPCFVHPGGTDIILEWAGKDGTEAFAAAGHRQGIVQRKGLGEMLVGKMTTPGAGLAEKPDSGPPYGAHPAEWAREVDGVAVGFPPGGWRTVIGRSTWHYLHSSAAKYPEHSPAPEQEAGMKALVTSLGALYPCEACRYALGPELESLPPIPTATRKGVVLWWCELHNLVNTDIGNEEYPCTMEALDDIYLKNCGSCSTAASGTITLSLGNLGDGSGSDDDEEEEDEGECCEPGDEDCTYEYECVDEDEDEDGDAEEGADGSESDGTEEVSQTGGGAVSVSSLEARIAALEAENAALRAAAASE